MSFESDLAEGEDIEIIFATRLHNSGCHSIIGKVRGYFKPYDLVGYNAERKREATYEVKHDRLCKTTGNVAIEFVCNGKPSVISTTLADRWAVHVEGTFYVFDPKKMEEWIKGNMYVYVTCTSGGDGGRAGMWLVPEYKLKTLGFCVIM